MFRAEEHIAKIGQAAKNWLQPDNEKLKAAINKTVEEGLFSLADIRHQVGSLKESIDSGQVRKWADIAGLSSKKHAAGKKVLCLHAGNLPLVSFQTALGVLLSGSDYFGKISRKDPYLLPTFLEEAVKLNTGQKISYSTDLQDFKNLEADVVIFAGSKETVPEVKEEIIKINAAKTECRYVIRTAKFSIAYIENQDKETMENLTEAVFRYGGKGCRSVAVVVTKFPLDTIKCSLTDYIESFWLKNPQHLKPAPVLKYRFAYNKAVERSQAWLQDFLLQEADGAPETDFTLNWIVGDAKKVKELLNRYQDQIQSVYTSGIKIEGIQTEFLSQAQRPPLWWKPDGTDVIEELIA